MSNFVHLHNHSEYSLLDGFARIKNMVAKAKASGMSACAITDHGVMYGVVDFYKECKKQGIKPILGCEVYVAMRSRFDKDPVKDKNRYHLILLAKNETGYKNLCTIVSKASHEGFYYKPRVDKELLREYSEGLICLSACLAGEIPKALCPNPDSGMLDGDFEKAKAIALDYLDIFGEGNYYLEIQDQGIPVEKGLNREIAALSKELNIPLVATNDVHFIDQEDAAYHDVLLCIQTGKTVDEENRMRFSTDQFYFKTGEEMEEVFRDYPEAIENTQLIADKCEVEFHFAPPYYLPDFPVPQGYDAISYLKMLCNKGIEKRYSEITPEITERLEYELDVIIKMDFPSYFLIVWDMINFAKDNNIMVGPGRGSAAGSIVAYALGITDIDPLKYNLLFERFLNPDRVSMPDIDTDFCIERRGEVFKYLAQKYGNDRVAQIITFGTMKAKLAVKDVGRAFDMPYKDVERVAKQIPDDLGMTITKALAENSDLKNMYDNEPPVKRLIDCALKLEGMPRHHGLHAAALVIAPDTISNYLPVIKADGDALAELATQYAKDTVEEMGLLKMDLLGLRNLTVIRDALQNIKASQDIDLDINTIPLDDKKTYAMLSRGEGNGVFQMESEGMQQVMRNLQPENIAEITALVALYRPGPIGSGMVKEFTERKHGRMAISYDHPILEPLLKETYGVILYQEQVMLIAQQMAGFTMAQADYLRKAMGKKKIDIIAGYRKTFVEGAQANGVKAAIATKIFDQMEKFAEYGFNKSHSVAYAVVAYQTAYLKANYPTEYSAALLTSLMDKTDKLADYIDECRRMGMKVLPPHINESRMNFTAVNGSIRFGFAAIKNVGQKPSEVIVAEREANGDFTSLLDFCKRVSVNSRMLESLIQCGAFDNMGMHRGQLLAITEKCMSLAEKSRKDDAAGLMSLFEFGLEEEKEDEQFPEVAKLPPLSKEDMLKMEKNMLGLFLTGHILDGYTGYWRDYQFTNIRELASFPDKKETYIAGMLTHLKIKSNKSGQRFGQFDFEDLTGKVHCFVFARSFESVRNYLNEDAIICMRGTVRNDDGKINFNANDVLPIKMSRNIGVLSNSGTINICSNEDVNPYEKGLDVLECPEDILNYEENIPTKENIDFIPTVHEELHQEKQIVKRLYLNLLPGKNSKDEELAIRKILARYPGPHAAFGYNKANGKAKRFGFTVSAEDEMIVKMEQLLGKENVFVKILEN
ncbi:MAG: DNA polymerase III subunit alpha [Clostridiales bacterium]